MKIKGLMSHKVSIIKVIFLLITFWKFKRIYRFAIVEKPRPSCIYNTKENILEKRKIKVENEDENF